MFSRFYLTVFAVFAVRRLLMLRSIKIFLIYLVMIGKVRGSLKSRMQKSRLEINKWPYKKGCMQIMAYEGGVCNQKISEDSSDHMEIAYKTNILIKL